MREIEALAKYLPSHLVESFAGAVAGGEVAALDAVPRRETFESVCLFADVSGFTALCERLASLRPEGAEDVARYINAYVAQIVRIIAKCGGDVVKFAGDAVITIWPPAPGEDAATLCRRAVQAGLEIQHHLHESKFTSDIVLSVKIGIGVGPISMAHIGGVSDGLVDARLEFVATGDPLHQAFHAEHQAEAGDVVLSAQAFALVDEFFDGTPHQQSCFKVSAARARLRARSAHVDLSHVTGEHEATLRLLFWRYVPSAVTRFLSHDEELWAHDMRQISVLFVNLGLDESLLTGNLPLEHLELVQSVRTPPLPLRWPATCSLCCCCCHRCRHGHCRCLHPQVFTKVQSNVFEYEGTINKFLVDDKGSTLIAGPCC